jgi:hypothetical protein
MLKKRTDIVKFAFCAALCGMPAVSIAARAQDQTPPPEHKQQDREKNHTGQDEKRQNRPAETRPTSHAAQGQAQDHPTEAQPRNRSAEHQPQERQSRPAEERPRNGAAERPPQERQNRSAEQRPENNGAQRQNHGAQVAQGGGHRPASNAHYQFRQQDVPKLRQHFQGQLAHVNRNNRPHVVAGGSLPGGWQTYIVPVPTEEFAYLPPVPEGYQMAFYDGYIIVYDPYSGLVVDVIDLFAY